MYTRKKREKHTATRQQLWRKIIDGRMQAGFLFIFFFFYLAGAAPCCVRCHIQPHILPCFSLNNKASQYFY